MEAFMLIPIESREDIQTRWFALFWEKYWRKKGKAEAWKSFKRAVKTPALWDAVWAALNEQWQEQMERDPQHRPHATTWLNQRRWEDEPDPPKIEAVVAPRRFGTDYDKLMRRLNGESADVM